MSANPEEFAKRVQQRFECCLASVVHFFAVFVVTLAQSTSSLHAACTSGITVSERVDYGSIDRSGNAFLVECARAGVPMLKEGAKV